MIESRTSAMVEGALLAGLTALLVLIGIYIPPLALVTNFIWTVPLALLVVRQDLRTGILATVVSGLLVVMLSEPITALFIFLQYGALGLVYGLLFKRKVSSGRALFAGTLVAALSMVVTLLLSVWLMGAPLEYLPEQMNQIVDDTMEFYQKTGLTGSLEQQGLTPEEMRKNLENLMGLLVTMIPGILVISSVTSAFINYLLARMVLVRLSYDVPYLPPFSEWRLPANVIWGLIAALAITLWGDYAGVTLLKTIGQNVLYIYLPLLLFTGLAVVKYYYRKWNIPPLVKGLIILAAVINLYLTLGFIILLGAFDPVVDYRRLKLTGKGE